MTVREAHNLAMLLSDWTDQVLAAGHGNPEWARGKYSQACDLEAYAADQVPADPANEPTRSLLYVSAASLAKLAEDIPRMHRLIEKGAQGTLPPGCLKAFVDLKNSVAGPPVISNNSNTP